MSQIFILLSYLSRNNPKYPKIITEQIFISFSLPTRKIPSIQIDDSKSIRSTIESLSIERKENKEGKRKRKRGKKSHQFRHTASSQKRMPINFMTATASAAGPTGLAQSPKQLRHSTGLHPAHNCIRAY